jgi:hypothetical protein
MAPEQARGVLVDARADLYALGCILYELITGDPPFDGSGFEVLLAHLGRPVPKPSEKVPSTPPIVDELVGKMCAKKPDQRVQSADELVSLIDDVLDELEGLRPATPVSQAGAARSPARRAKRKTAGTIKDKPEPRATSYLDPEPAQTQPIHRWRWLFAGAVIASVLAVAGFATFNLTRASNSDADTGGAVKRYEVFRDDGDTRMRLFVPETMKAGRQNRMRIELRNKLGAYIVADQVVVTIEDPQGKATGLIARPRSSDPNQYGFAQKFALPGVYKIRIFPPETQSTFTVDVTVEP